MSDPGQHGNEIIQPQFEYVVDITNALNAVAELSDDTDYSIGQLISFRVSQPYGMREINNKVARILSISGNFVTTDIDSTNFTPFIYPVSGKNTPPIVVPVGSGIIPDSNPATVNLLDTFDCVRP